MFPQYYMDSDNNSRFKFSTTHWSVNVAKGLMQASSHLPNPAIVNRCVVWYGCLRCCWLHNVCKLFELLVFVGSVLLAGECRCRSGICM